MIEFTDDPATTTASLDLDRVRAAVPTYQRAELPRRLRGERRPMPGAPQDGAETPYSEAG